MAFWEVFCLIMLSQDAFLCFCSILQVFCVYIMSSSFEFLWDSWECDCVCLCMCMNFLCFFFGSLSCSDVLKFVCFLFYYYSLDVCLLSNERRKGVDLDRQGGGEKLGGVRGEETIFPEYSVLKKFYFNKRKKYLCNYVENMMLCYI